MSERNFKPMSDNVLVKVPPKKEKSDGGIIIPETAAQEKPQEGMVIAVGPGRLLADGTRAPMLVKPGDTVLYGKYAGIAVNLNNVDYLSIRQDDILLVEMESETE